MCGHYCNVLRGLGLPSGQCAVTSTTLLSAACQVLGAAFRLTAPRRWIVDLLHGGISYCSLTGQAVATYGMGCRSFPAVTALVPDQGSSPIPGWR